MKNQRSGKAEILSEAQLVELLAQLPHPHQAIFAICYYTSCRISEALQLKASDLMGDRIVFRAGTTKTGASREVVVSRKLAEILKQAELPQSGYLFPGRGGGHLTRQAADKVLRHTTDYLGLKGVSTHSMRRTGITKLSRAGVALRTIQAHTGHKSLGSLGHYIEVDQAEVDAAVGLL